MDNHVMVAFFDELEKIAADIDQAKLKELAGTLRPGDIVSFSPHAADQKSLKDLAMTSALSGAIRKATGSPYSHTAMIDSIDPDTGRIKIIHNYEQGKASGVSHAYLDEFADTTSFKFTRPRVSQDVAARAVEHARSAIGGSKYSKRDLIGMAPQEVVRNLRGQNAPVARVASAVTGLGSAAGAKLRKSCDPATGVCSYLPVHAYGQALGSEHDAARLLAGDVDYTGRTSVSPKMLAMSDELDHVGDYVPMNLNASVRGQAKKLLRDGAAARLRKLF